LNRAVFVLRSAFQVLRRARSELAAARPGPYKVVALLGATG
jgi:hypothetical protein